MMIAAVVFICLMAGAGQCIEITGDFAPTTDKAAPSLPQQEAIPPLLFLMPSSSESTPTIHHEQQQPVVVPDDVRAAIDHAVHINRTGKSNQQQLSPKGFVRERNSSCRSTLHGLFPERSIKIWNLAQTLISLRCWSSTFLLDQISCLRANFKTSFPSCEIIWQFAKFSP